MDTILIDGNLIKEKILNELKKEVNALIKKYKTPPGLAVILVGDNPASQFYVKMKKKACSQIGIFSFEYILPSESSQEELEGLLRQLNNDDKVDGILLQLPLPNKFDEQKLLEMISPEKDVDGFHPMNVGKLLLGLDTFYSCTPFGVIELLKNYNIELKGKNVVIVGRSNIVGKPLGAMLIQKGLDATVTIAHSKTKNLAEICSKADILISAIGKPKFITSEYIKDGAVVIDVGINRVSADNDKGYKIVGDIDFEQVKEKCSFITPVPGGVGPMTIAMLMKNTIKSYKSKYNI